MGKWKTIKSKIKAKHIIKKYIPNGRFESDFVFLENSITEFKELILFTKASYYENIGKKIKQLIIASKNLLANPKNIL